MKTFSLILLICSLVAIQMCEYKNGKFYRREHKYSLILPKGWKEDFRTEDGISFIAPEHTHGGKTDATINVLFYNFVDEITLDSFYELIKNEGGLISDKIIEEGLASVDSYLAKWTLIDYGGTSQGAPAKRKRYIIVTDPHSAYIIEFMVHYKYEDFGKYKEIFENFINNFDIKR